MAIVYVLSLGVLLGAYALPQDFGVKSVKGGGNNTFSYNANANLDRFYNASQHNQSDHHLSDYHGQRQGNLQVQSGNQFYQDYGQDLQSQYDQNQFNQQSRQMANQGPNPVDSGQSHGNFQFYGEEKEHRNDQRHTQFMEQHQFVVQNHQGGQQPVPQNQLKPGNQQNHQTQPPPQNQLMNYTQPQQNQWQQQTQQTQQWQQQNHFGQQLFRTRNVSEEADHIDYEKGVCYKEVPTALLARDPSHIPAGNGSTPELSRIRACCAGYIRNLHNARLCDPVCARGCVNAACTAPDVCSCFPDHVINLAGFCMPTCPIGCQNGQCVGGECMCNEGFELDKTGKFCVPVCKGGCRGIGNCTEPNTCDCRRGYRPTADGSCAPRCDGCDHGVCTGPDQCRCHDGYRSEDGVCVPSCPRGCHSPGKCTAPDVCSCPPGFHLDLANRCSGEPLTNASTAVLPMKISLGQGCPKPCINGVCRDGLCNCKPGYKPDRSDPTGNRCLPSCPGGCVNGVCSGPNFCICNFGFIKDRSVKGGAVCREI